MTQWKTMDSAPRDGTPILGWCEHEADPYFLNDGRRLTQYGAHCEGQSFVEDGPHVLVWGGGFDDRSYDEPTAACMSDWWYRNDADLEVAANPIAWMPIPEFKK
jgi:hypothetical protein